MGRPKKPIDPEQVRKLAEKQWSNEQIAAVLGIHATNLQRRFADILANGRHHGKAKLIDLLWHRAVNGSDKMLEHALNRFLGPIPQKIQMTKEMAFEYLEKLSDEAGTGETNPSSEETDKDE